MHFCRCVLNNPKLGRGLQVRQEWRHVRSSIFLDTALVGTLKRDRRSFLSVRQCIDGSGSDPCTLEDVMSEVASDVVGVGPLGTVGVGSGDLVAAFLEYLANEKADVVGNMRFVPTSLSVESELKMLGLPIAPVTKDVDIFVDQADHVHVMDSDVYYIVGTGENGPQVGQPDVPTVLQVASTAPRITLLCKGAGLSSRLSGQLPIFIEGDEVEWEEYAEEIDDIFLGDGEVTRRSNSEDANTRGMPDPVITSDGNMILDVAFYKDLRLFGESVPYTDIIRAIEMVDGVVCTGLIRCSAATQEILVVHQVNMSDETCMFRTRKVS